MFFHVFFFARYKTISRAWKWERACFVGAPLFRFERYTRFVWSGRIHLATDRLIASWVFHFSLVIHYAFFCLIFSYFHLYVRVWCTWIFVMGLNANRREGKFNDVENVSLKFEFVRHDMKNWECTRIHTVQNCVYERGWKHYKININILPCIRWRQWRWNHITKWM